MVNHAGLKRTMDFDIFPLGKKNPYRIPSCKYHSFEIILNNPGIHYHKYAELGGAKKYIPAFVREEMAYCKWNV